MSDKKLKFFHASTDKTVKIPYYSAGVKAGFPSPAADFSESAIDLNEELIKNAPATFFVRASGDSMKDAGIFDGDLLVVDKSLEATDGKIAVCCIDGEFTLKRIKIDKDCGWLMPANDAYKPIKVTEDNDFMIWGIVTHSITSF